MNETFKRILAGLVYIAIMWFGTKLSHISFHALFSVILFIAIYEMWKLRKGKTTILPYICVILPLFLIHKIESRNLILYMFILTWTFDIFAYIFGVTFGKHKIIPSISPKKSWEGFVGGFLLTLITAYIIIILSLIPVLGKYEENYSLYLITSIIPFTATMGDFIISYYKRIAGVKDSGSFIPGHGGILDRIDAFLITIPVIYILTKLL